MQHYNVTHSAPTLSWCVDADPQVHMLGLQRCMTYDMICLMSWGAIGTQQTPKKQLSEF